MPMLKLQSSDGEDFEVEKVVACMSKTIKTMLEDLDIGDDDEVIPLPNVNSKTLKLVKKWAEHHQNDPAPDDDDSKEKRTDDISDWDKSFLNLDKVDLFELILAANYLDMKGLLDATCKTVANMIKGKTSDEIRKTFNIKNDFTKEEEEQIHKENGLLEDK